MSDYGGSVRLDKKGTLDELDEIHIVTSSVLIKDAIIKNEFENESNPDNLFLNFSDGINSNALFTWEQN